MNPSKVVRVQPNADGSYTVPEGTVGPNDVLVLEGQSSGFDRVWIDEAHTIVIDEDEYTGFRTYDEVPRVMINGVGCIDRFRFYESPTLKEPTMQRAKKAKTRTSKRPGYYRGGEKELERGARSFIAPSPTNGYPLVQVHSKRFYDAHVELVEG